MSMPLDITPLRIIGDRSAVAILEKVFRQIESRLDGD